MTMSFPKKDRNPEIDPSPSPSYTQWTVTDSTHLLGTLCGSGWNLTATTHSSSSVWGSPLQEVAPPNQVATDPKPHSS